MRWFSCALMAVLAIAPVGVFGQAENDTEEPTAAAQPGEKEARPAPRSRAAATTRPTRTSSRRNARPAVKFPAAAGTIVDELGREFETGKLRKQSDYLKSSPNAEMTADVILAMLQRQFGNSDAQEAYIKWQLLSGLPDPLPEQYADDAMTAYASAPGLAPRPGMFDEDRRVLDREVRRVNDPTQLTAALVSEVRRVDLLNEPVLSYRDTLFAKSPESLDLFIRGLQDLYARGQAGITSRNFGRAFSQRVANWMPKASPDDLGRLYDALSELLTVSMPEYYDSLENDRDSGGYRWTRRRASVNDGGQLQVTADSLISAIQSAQPQQTQQRRRR